MEYHEIGKTGMKVSSLSFGASSLGGVFHDIREKEGLEAVFTAIDLGMNFIDVSPYYGHYKAETVLGKALKEIPRDKYYLSTKVGRYGKDGVNTWDYSGKRATESVYESMERLHVDYIDLINVHDIEFADLNQVVNETLPALVELREKGVVGHVGITDLQLENLKWVIDHSPAGTVESVLNPYTNCGKCASCRNGRVNACEHNETLGVQRNGVMCEYAVLPWSKVIPAEGISSRDCALIEPMSVGFHAVSRGQVIDNEIVMVIGCGMVGMGAIVRAALRGATVIAVDLDDEKLALAREVGATYVINSRTENVHERVQEYSGGLGADVVIEAVGSPATYVMAVDEVSFTGRVVCIGYAKSGVEFQTKYFVQKELDIRGSRNALPADFRAVIHYMKTGNCPVEKLISSIVSPENASEAMEGWAVNPGKVFRILVKF